MAHSEKDLAWLNAVRNSEFDVVRQLIIPKSVTSLLEIGSGTGYILSRFKELCSNVAGLEVFGSSYSQQNEDISFYDGVNIPCDASSYDLIVSFHVLEHATQIGPLLEDCERVLTDQGMMIHVLPSSTWRFLTTFLWYFGAAAYLIRKIGDRVASAQNILDERVRASWRDKIFPKRHGELGNAFTEIFYFRKKRWVNQFQESGFNVVKVEGSGIVYWGHDFLRTALSLRTRKMISRLIGSSSIVYVLTKR